jgi:hypothetical protein
MKRWQKVTLGAGVGALATYILWRLWPKKSEEEGPISTPMEPMGNGYQPPYDPNQWDPSQPYDQGQPIPDQTTITTSEDTTPSCPPGQYWDAALPGCVTPPKEQETFAVPDQSTDRPPASSVPVTLAAGDPRASRTNTSTAQAACPPGTYFNNITGECTVLAVE